MILFERIRRIRKCDFVVESVSLEVGFEISKAQLVSLFLLSVDRVMDFSATSVSSCLPAWHYVLHHDDNGLTSETKHKLSFKCFLFKLSFLVMFLFTVVKQ